MTDERLQRIERQVREIHQLVLAMARKTLPANQVAEILGETPRPKTPERRRGQKGPTTGGVRGLDDLTRRRD